MKCCPCFNGQKVLLIAAVERAAAQKKKALKVLQEGNWQG